MSKLHPQGRKPALRALATAGLVLLISSLQAASASLPAAFTLADPRSVKLGGGLGQAFERGVKRLDQAPFTADWLLADVSFKMDRIFTNYSGDASGRFIELATLTSPHDPLSPPALGPVLAAIAQYQKPDGHFGLDIDLSKPLVKLATPIPMLWGNARLLVGLVTAARESNDPKLLQAAKHLGDFYVNSSAQLCSPSREAEYRASGTYGDGYTCCYFPVIEGLVLLYTATHEPRYLNQAHRMADWFQKFDVLPVEHSHGNLCAWRGVLELYAVTGESTYLERAIAKWEAAMQGGYVWSLGGIGEHWNVFYEGDEGCSESDWLRFNLDLWRFTGKTRYLDIAERLLANEYLSDQCPNGGYGMRHFDGDAGGPIGTRGGVDEWPFCCSFHGPLGLHFLKAYLAAGSERGVYLNFPVEFTAPVKVAATEWTVSTRRTGYQTSPSYQLEIKVAPKSPAPADCALWIRIPDWATNARCTTSDGITPVPGFIENGYLRVACKGATTLLLSLDVHIVLESRRFQPFETDLTQGGTLINGITLLGPHVLFAAPSPAAGKWRLLATMDATGAIGFLTNRSGTQMTVVLPKETSGLEQVNAALESGEVVALQPWPDVKTQDRVTFVNDYYVIPADRLSTKALEAFRSRLAASDRWREKPASAKK